MEFPLLVTRNGMYASRTITGIDFSKQNITWSGNILEGEEAFLGMLSSEQIASSVNYCTSFLNCTRHEGGFIFSNQSRYSLL